MKTKTTGYNNLMEVMKHFSDEKVCRKHLEDLRWNGKPVCPFCSHDKVYKTSAGYKCANPKCYKKFTVLVGTFFENTKIPLSKWFVALYLATSHKKGISSLQLHRDINVTQKTAWFMMHRIREMLKAKSPIMLSGIVEADETYVGGKMVNKHKSKKTKVSHGRSDLDKTPVLGLLQRDGKVVSQVIDDARTHSIQPIILRSVEQGANLMTDDYVAYRGLTAIYNHQVINHSTGSYVDGICHTNTIEGFWSLFKRGIIGIYHSVSRKHLDKYCNEFEYRYNTRDISQTDRFDASIKQCNGRLKYKHLIA